MAGLRKQLQKLTLMDTTELRVRVSQMAASLSERRGWSSLATLPDDQSLVELLDHSQPTRALSSPENFQDHFRSRSAPRFLAGFANKDATIAQFRARWPGAEAEVIENANRILQGSFDLLGFRDLSFGTPIDWHLEPISGKRTPRIHWSQLDYLNAEVAGDKKITWELNRHQYFSTLGQAYWLTNDERYAQEFVTHLESWMAQNPPKLGINWASSLEVGFRSISWLWAFYFFKDSSSLTAATFWRALKFLYLHARHLETYLSTYFSPNTHLTGEALALFYLGTTFPEFKESARWKDTGRNILMGQLSRHIRDDGVYFEQSSYYHRYTTDFYIHFVLLSLANGEDVSPEVLLKLAALLDHLMYITRPDGTTPFFGDDDGGRLVMLDRRPANDFRAALATAAVMFERRDYKFVAREAAEETLWLLGPAALDTFDGICGQEPANTSMAFPDGGYWVMRDAWTEKANYLLLDCGPHGAVSCGHAHADALSIELAANGRTTLVDPGTYTYTGSREMRDWFRSSVAHNTLTIDRQSSSISDGPFSWLQVAHCEQQDWISRDRFDYFAGRHDGYQRFNPPVNHTRSVLFLKKDYWILRDKIKAKGKHQADLWLHFDSTAAPLIVAGENAKASPWVLDQSTSGGLAVFTFGPNGQWRREEGWVSHCYGIKQAARIYAFSAAIERDEELVTFLMPFESEFPDCAVRKVEAIGGKAFEITHKNGLDVVMISDGESRQTVESKRLTSNFAWTWVRFTKDDDTTPVELVLVRGTTLALGGREILHLPREINALTASRIGARFHVKTDLGMFDCDLPIVDLVRQRTT